MRTYGITMQAVIPGNTYPVTHSGCFVAANANDACGFAVEMMKSLYPAASRESISCSSIAPIAYSKPGFDGAPPTEMLEIV